MYVAHTAALLTYVFSLYNHLEINTIAPWEWEQKQFNSEFVLGMNKECVSSGGQL
jgi:hypothetical protein